MKKFTVIGIIFLLSLTISGCFGQNESVSPAPLSNNNKTISHHLFYLGESKDWIGEYEVSGQTIFDGSKYSNISEGILTLTYKNKDYSPKDKVVYGFDSLSNTLRENGYMSPNGILVLTTHNEDVSWLENNPKFTIPVTITIHAETEKFNLSLKSK